MSKEDFNRTLKKLLLSKQIISPVLVGRASPLKVLADTWGQVEQRQGRIALVWGEAGIGKSRLVQEVKKQLSTGDWLLLQGNCYESDATLPYAPFQDLIRQILLSPAQDDLVASLGLIPPELLNLLPDLATWIPSAKASPVSFDPELLKHRLIGALLQIVTSLAKRRPVLLIFEDVHWSDPSGLEALLHLARRITSQSILLLLTFRESAAQTAAPLRKFLAELNRERLAIDLELKSLSLTEVAAMLAAIFDLPRPIRAEFLTTLYQLSEGNPFFLEEILRSLIASGDIFFQNGSWERKPVAELHIPKSIQDTVQTRLQHISQIARELLNLSAVIGRDFSFNLLLKLSTLDAGQVLEKLKELLDAQLITESEFRPDYFTFRHALIREAVYAKLLTIERRKLHLVIATTLEQQATGEITDERLEQLAYHFFKAAEWDKTATYSWQAAEWAFSLHSFHSVIEQINRYLEANRHLARPNSTQIYRMRGIAFETLGDFERARENYEAALAVALEQFNPKGQWQSLIDLGQYWLGHNYETAGEYFNRSLDLARQMADPILLATSYNRLGNWLANTGRTGEAIKAHQQALEIFETASDKAGVVETLEVLGMAQAVQGNMLSAFEAYEKACPLFVELGDQQRLVTSLVMKAVTSSPAYCDVTAIRPRSLAECQSDFEEASVLTQRLDWLAGQSFTGLECGFVLAAFGKFGQGNTCLREALAIAKNIEHEQWSVGAQTMLGRQYLYLLDGEQAYNFLKPAYESAQKLGSAIWSGYSTAWLGLAYLLQGNPQEAEKLLARHLPPGSIARNIGERMICWAWCELKINQGKYHEALEIAEQLIETAGGDGKRMGSPNLFRLKGEALQSLGKLEEAAEALVAAKDAAEYLQAGPVLWKVRAGLGRIYSQLKMEQAAVAEFSAARSLVGELAATIEENRGRENFVENALKEIPTEKRTPMRATNLQNPGGLTDREREIAGLIAQGKSNLEIAQRLVVSKRTVETHITNILTKLNFSSRSQVAVWAARNGL